MSETTAQAMNTGQQEVYLEALEEIATTVALGVLPGVAQAIDVYDTLESIWRLHSSPKAADKEEAQFDLVLALIGWVPLVGDGVKKSFRLVNKKPERFGPVLFDVIRSVCDKAGIKTDPVAYIDDMLSSGFLSGQLNTAKAGIRDSWLYKELTPTQQGIVDGAFDTLTSQLPNFVGIVEKRWKRWKGLQRNNSAQPHLVDPKNKRTDKPGNSDADVNSKGKSTPNAGSTFTSINGEVAMKALEKIEQKAIGILGEHITDYYLYEKRKWGGTWHRHDVGGGGEWKQRPGKDHPGKLNEQTLLNQLFAPKAHGTGIDGVWRVPASGLQTGGKPYAIVEAKASKVHVAKTVRDKNKVSVKSKLGTASLKESAEESAPKAEELLEPPIGDVSAGNSQTVQKGDKKKRGKVSSSHQPAVPTSKKSEPSDSTPQEIVQMSHDWIKQNLNRALEHNDDLVIDILYGALGKKINYSRHLFYTPFYTVAGWQHFEALVAGDPNNHSAHENHDIWPNHQFDDAKIEKAVKEKTAALQKRKQQGT